MRIFDLLSNFLSSCVRNNRYQQISQKGETSVKKMNIFDVMPEHVLTSQNTSEIVDFALNIIKGVKFVFYDDFVITDINNHKKGVFVVSVKNSQKFKTDDLAKHVKIIQQIRDYSSGLTDEHQQPQKYLFQG